MGGCCPQEVETPLVNNVSRARVTDSMLHLRKSNVLLTPSEASAVVQCRFDLTYNCYIEGMKSLLSSRNPALLPSDFKQTFSALQEDMKDFFRKGFIEGSPGEGVGVKAIFKAEQDLIQTFEMDYDLFKYCNQYKSYQICTRLKRRILRNEIHGSPNKNRLLKLYDQEAQGAYASRCREDLIQLLSLYSKTRPQAMFSLLENQSAADRQILGKEKTAAIAKSRTTESRVFNSTVSDSNSERSVSNSVMQSRVSVLDLIDRFPSFDAGDESRTGSYYLSEQIFATDRRQTLDPGMPLYSPSEKSSKTSQKSSLEEIEIRHSQTTWETKENGKDYDKERETFHRSKTGLRREAASAKALKSKRRRELVSGE